ncbi:uncharacterized protein LOC113472269 [Diaphorina citri]|uniref:Uncharacterized protein LOC113472269 n=1 Tax=Diaphorina citri TaxID=121845 RepID=A0A3Q0JH34_DIACI|nr:uncharacterized protein LOC113472269 [Diaphorina citri]
MKMTFAVVQFNEDDPEVFINLSCRSRSIYDYLIEAYNVPGDTKHIDLYDKTGKLIALPSQPDQRCATEYLQPAEKYYLVVLDVDGDQYVNSVIGNMKNGVELLAAINRQLSRSEKSVDIAKSRISTKRRL